MGSLAVLGSLIAAAIPAAARADSASSTIAVSLVVEPSCRVSATPMAFAGRAGETMDATSRIEVACAGDTPVSVRLDGGRHADGGGRRLAGDAGHVAYQVYTDPARSSAWDPGRPLTGTAGTAPLSLAAYGRVGAAATLAAAAGDYRDTITISVDF